MAVARSRNELEIDISWRQITQTQQTTDGESACLITTHGINTVGRGAAGSFTGMVGLRCWVAIVPDTLRCNIVGLQCSA